MLICPYCRDEKTMDDLSCCGESCMHFIEVCDDCGEEDCECVFKQCLICGCKYPKSKIDVCPDCEREIETMGE